jgi:hypothetical protein
VAKMVCHEAGLPWTDPRTRITHQPPNKPKPMNNNSRARFKKLTRKQRAEQVRLSGPRKSKKPKVGGGR